MEKKNLDEQLKEAEIQRRLSEAAKHQAEKQMFEDEIAANKNKRGLKWYKKSVTWRFVLTVLISITILGFYINYIVVPTAEIKNIGLSLQNAQNSMRLKVLLDSAEQLTKNLDSLKSNITNWKIKLQNTNDSLAKVISVINIMNDHIREIEYERKRLKEENIKDDNRITRLNNQLSNTSDSLLSLSRSFDSLYVQFKNENILFNSDLPVLSDIRLVKAPGNPHLVYKLNQPVGMFAMALQQINNNPTRDYDSEYYYHSEKDPKLGKHTYTLPFKDFYQESNVIIDVVIRNPSFVLDTILQ